MSWDSSGSAPTTIMYCKNNGKQSVKIRNGPRRLVKFRKIVARSDFELKWTQRLELEWWTFRSRGPQGAAPSTRTRQKKEGDGRKKEEPRKKE